MNEETSLEDDLRPEYGEDELRELLKTGVRGKYVSQVRNGMNLIKLAPDVRAAFPTERAVNDALRKLIAEKPRAA